MHTRSIALAGILAATGLGGLAAADGATGEVPPDIQADDPYVDRIITFRRSQRLLPRGKLTWDDDRLRLHVLGSLVAGYDSNLSNTSEGDGFLAAELGTQGAMTWSERDESGYDVRLILRRYLDLEDDYSGYYLDAYHRHRSTVLDANVRAGAARSDLPIPLTGETVLRRDITPSAGCLYLGNFTTLGAELAFQATDWLEASRDFDEDERDLDELDLRLSLDRQLGSALGLGLRLHLDRRTYSGTGRYQDSTGSRLAAHAAWQSTARSLLTVDLGLEHRGYADDFASDPAYDDETSLAPILNLAWKWEPEYFSHLRIVSSYGSEEGLYANTMTVFHAAIEGKYRLAWDTHCILRQEFDEYRHGGSSAGSPIPRTTAWTTVAILGAQFSKGLAASLEARYTARDSTIEADSDQLLSLAEFSFAY